MLQYDHSSRRIKAWLALHEEEGGDIIFLWSAEASPSEERDDGVIGHTFWMGVTASCGGLFEAVSARAPWVETLKQGG